jgi:hypothetical protein
VDETRSGSERLHPPNRSASTKEREVAPEHLSDDENRRIEKAMGRVAELVVGKEVAQLVVQTANVSIEKPLH